MQDLRSIPNGGGNGGGGGGGGRFFGGDRRLRPYPNQALKCPRCDSLNTKFCYYNNYNLSQPRHFCKSCRRYWTKGGVLRNVPVGGGCRKTKRSKPKSSSSSDHHPHHHHHHHQKEKKSSNSHSSSESSSLTATTTNDAAAVGGGGASSSSVPGLLSFPDSRLFMNQTSHNPNFQLEILDQSSAAAAVADCGIFAENGSFTSLMSVGNTYNFNEITPFRINHQEEIELQEQQKMTSMVEEMKMQELTAAACMDQTVGIELSGIENRTSNGGGGGGGGLDWQSSQGLFDLPNSVDHGYWNQNQWADNDQHLYLP